MASVGGDLAGDDRNDFGVGDCAATHTNRLDAIGGSAWQTLMVSQLYYYPNLVGQRDARILDHVFGIDDGKLTIAREYGFKNWDDVESMHDRQSDVAFEIAVDTMLSGNLPPLMEQVRATPTLPNARSEYGHNATLLHYAGTNGVESYRQVVPLNLAEIVDFLIASGADHGSKANIYAHRTDNFAYEATDRNRPSFL